MLQVSGQFVVGSRWLWIYNCNPLNSHFLSCQIHICAVKTKGMKSDTALIYGTQSGNKWSYCLSNGKAQPCRTVGLRPLIKFSHPAVSIWKQKDSPSSWGSWLLSVALRRCLVRGWNLLILLCSLFFTY